MTSAQSMHRITFAKDAKCNSHGLSNAPELKRGAQLIWTDSGFGISGYSAAAIDSLIRAILDDLTETVVREGPPMSAKTVDADGLNLIGRGAAHADAPKSGSRHVTGASIEPEDLSGGAELNQAELRAKAISSTTS